MLLAARLKVAHYDLDEIIERQRKRTISAIFEFEGERSFRRLESKALAGLCAKRIPFVVALGGGAFEKPDNRRLIQDSGISIFLSCSVPVLARRLKDSSDRPLIAGRQLENKIKSLLYKRLPNYRKADLVCATTARTKSETVSRILRLLKKYRATH